MNGSPLIAIVTWAAMGMSMPLAMAQEAAPESSSGGRIRLIDMASLPPHASQYQEWYPQPIALWLETFTQQVAAGSVGKGYSPSDLAKLVDQHPLDYEQIASLRNLMQILMRQEYGDPLEKAYVRISAAALASLAPDDAKVRQIRTALQHLHRQMEHRGVNDKELMHEIQVVVQGVVPAGSAQEFNNILAQIASYWTRARQKGVLKAADQSLLNEGLAMAMDLERRKDEYTGVSHVQLTDLDWTIGLILMELGQHSAARERFERVAGVPAFHLHKAAQMSIAYTHAFEGNRQKAIDQMTLCIQEQQMTRQEAERFARSIQEALEKAGQ